MREATRIGPGPMQSVPEKGTDGNSVRIQDAEETSSAVEQPDRVNHANRHLVLVPALPVEQTQAPRRMRPTIACMLAAGLAIPPGRRPPAGHRNPVVRESLDESTE
ncbi:hypothetical protein KCMC57_63760 (plasmid) [Kitasatospora sp. CMC57]|uniref:Uncharacterized protein n=1 Tax=Kitasatospora sp. CMC57 TaxID=3231513 RepID=A0AB33K469_9ACTN